MPDPSAPSPVRPRTLPPPPSGKTGWPWQSRLDDPPPRAPGGRPWPRISVVIPSFAQGRFLEAALRSLLLQGYPELEVLVADGGSDDRSVAILERYAPHLAWWTSERDRGQAHGVNRGLARARGEILGWLNADDLLLPKSLERIARAFLRDPEVRVVAGLRRTVDAAGRVTGRWVRDLPTPERLRAYCCLSQETVYWRREVYEQIGPLDESMGFALDYEYWLRMLEAGYRFTVLPYYLGGCRDHPATKRATRDDARRRDLGRIRRRYGLGLSEEDALARQGPDWAERLALIEDLSASPLSASPRLAVALLRLLEREWASRRAASLYLRYRYRRPRAGAARASRFHAALFALAGELLGRPQPDRLDTPETGAGAIERPLIDPGELAAADLAGLPPDFLALGGGWSWLERSRDHVYRWAENDAELIVIHPSGERRRLVLDLESGPALDWGPWRLTVLDEEGDAIVVRERLAPHASVVLELPLEHGPHLRSFRLRVDSNGRPASEHDPRVLSFRATGCRWQGALL